jgi:hypothetical protein
VDPVVFPVVVGEPDDGLGADSESGLAPGRSFREGTFRGAFFDHLLTVNGPEMTVSMDGAEPVSFAASDMDVPVYDSEGRVFFLDVTRLDPDFVGDVQVGVKGQIRRVLREKLLAQ